MAITLTKNAQNAIEAANLYNQAVIEYAPDVRLAKYEIGRNLFILKNEYPATKQFKSVLETHCPDIPVKRVSYLIKISGHGDAEKGQNFDVSLIEKWVADNHPTLTSELTIWDKFYKAHKPAESDETDPGNVEDVTPEPSVADIAGNDLKALEAALDHFTTKALVNMTADQLVIARQKLHNAFVAATETLRIEQAA